MEPPKDDARTLGEEIPGVPIDPESGIDLSLIRENLKLTPWERILANDDTINFCDAARLALERDAAPEQTAGEADCG